MGRRKEDERNTGLWYVKTATVKDAGGHSQATGTAYVLEAEGRIATTNRPDENVRLRVRPVLSFLTPAPPLGSPRRASPRSAPAQQPPPTLTPAQPHFLSSESPPSPALPLACRQPRRLPSDARWFLHRRHPSTCPRAPSTRRLHIDPNTPCNLPAQSKLLAERTLNLRFTLVPLVRFCPGPRRHPHPRSSIYLTILHPSHFLASLTSPGSHPSASHSGTQRFLIDDAVVTLLHTTNTAHAAAFLGRVPYRPQILKPSDSLSHAKRARPVG